MARFIIPSTPAGSAYWKQRTQLDGVDYILVFDWAQRDGHWLLHLYDQDESPIATGIKLVSNYSLLRGVIDTRRPPGQIYCVDVNGSGLDAGFSDLGTAFELRYYDQAELAAIAAAPAT